MFSFPLFNENGRLVGIRGHFIFKGKELSNLKRREGRGIQQKCFGTTVKDRQYLSQYLNGQINS